MTDVKREKRILKAQYVSLTLRSVNIYCLVSNGWNTGEGQTCQYLPEISKFRIVSVEFISKFIPYRINLSFISTFKIKPMNYNWMTLSFPFLMSLKRAIKDIDQCRQVNKYLEKKLANNTAMIESVPNFTQF